MSVQCNSAADDDDAGHRWLQSVSKQFGEVKICLTKDPQGALPISDQTEMHQTEMNQTESFLHQQKTRVAHRRHWAHWGLGRTHPHANMGPHHLWPIRL